MTRRPRVLFIFSGWLMATACAPDSALECGNPFPFHGIGDEEFLLLAEATGGVVQIAPPEGPGFTSPALPQVSAHKFVALDAVNAIRFVPRPQPSIDMGSAPLAASDTFLAVPWGHTANCGPATWGDNEWVPPGAQVVFRVDNTRFYRGMQVIDVLAHYEPYPYAAAIRSTAVTSPPADMEEWMSPREYLDMLRALPPFDTTVTRLDRWREFDHEMRGGPTDWIERFPGPEVIRRARAWFESASP